MCDARTTASQADQWLVILRLFRSHVTDLYPAAWESRRSFISTSTLRTAGRLPRGFPPHSSRRIETVTEHSAAGLRTLTLKIGTRDCFAMRLVA